MPVADGLPVSDVATPAFRVSCFCVAVNLHTSHQDVHVAPGVTLCRGGELNRAVQVTTLTLYHLTNHRTQMRAPPRLVNTFSGYSG